MPITAASGEYYAWRLTLADRNPDPHHHPALSLQRRLKQKPAFEKKAGFFNFNYLRQL
jgi:hypothetical protein